MRFLKPHLTLLLVLLFSYTLVAQEKKDSLKIQFISYWSKGDTYKFKIKKFEQKWKNDTQIVNDSIVYDATFSVIDSTATNYKIKWKYKIDVAKNLNLPSNFKNAVSKFEDIEVIYTTSEVGDFLGIENWQELSSKMKNLSDELLKMFPEKDKNGIELKKTLSDLLNVYQTKEGVELYLAKDLQLFHFPFGVEFNTEQEIKYDEELPNIFGGKPLKALSKINFNEVDVENESCIFNRIMTIDPNDTKNMIQELFKKMEPNGNNFEDFKKNAIFEITDKNYYHYYYNPGIPIFISNERIININIKEKINKKIERLEIELVD